jgi:hypothetical protein
MFQNVITFSFINHLSVKPCHRNANIALVKTPVHTKTHNISKDNLQMAIDADSVTACSLL